MAYPNVATAQGYLGPSQKQLDQAKWEQDRLMNTRAFEGSACPPPTAPSCVVAADQLRDVNSNLHSIITELTGRLYPILSKNGSAGCAVEAISPDPSSDLYGSLMESRDTVNYAISRLRDLINEVRL